ncbi:MAG: hypothetical protein EOP49_41795 [Sphingobacteriales bacterium]|nr:MAG: hypothetical protein EOP49_41795 [Sphingobacteriales bacterium]
MKDPCIRQLLKNTKLAKYFRDGSSRVVEEMNLPVAKARVDIAVINGHLHGYEIKSASDTLSRLPGQIEAYTKVFDYLSVITEDKYAGKVAAIVPQWVGIYTCSAASGRLTRIRQEKINRHKEGFYLAKLLWREEIEAVLNENNIAYRKKDRNWILCELLAREIKTSELSAIVRGKLKNRTSWREPSTEGCVSA